MERRKFLQFIGLGSTLSLPLLFKPAWSKVIPTAIEPNDHQLAHVLPQIVNTNLNEMCRFENYVIGRCNQLAVAAARQASINPNKGYNPIFIHGGTGLGKTHLVHAMGNHMMDLRPGSRIQYLHSERLVFWMIKAFKANRIDEFREYFRSLDTLIIEDIQFFCGRERSQGEFSNILDCLMEKGAQIVLTGDRYTQQMEGMEERLRSHISSGLSLSIDLPDLETRMAIIQIKAAEFDIFLPLEITTFIASHIRSNIREVEGAVRRVAATTHFTGKPITLDFVKETLNDLISLNSRLRDIEVSRSTDRKVNSFVRDYIKNHNNDDALI